MARKNVTFSEALTLTRASPKWVWNNAGALTEVAIDTPAFQYDRNTNEKQGILVEESRTNLFLNSDAPATQTITVVDGTTYTVSVYGTGRADIPEAEVSVSDGAPVTFTASGTSITVEIVGSVDYCQVEEGSKSTSIIITGASPVTRDLDDIKGDASVTFNDVEGAAFVSLNFTPDISVNQHILEIGTGTSDNRITLYSEQGTNKIALDVRDGVDLASYVGPSIPNGLLKIAYNYFITGGGTEIVLAVNGTLYSTTFTQSPSGISEIVLGWHGNTSLINTPYKECQYYKAAQTENKLIELTTVPSPPEEGVWILADESWNDAGVWKDSDVWNEGI